MPREIFDGLSMRVIAGVDPKTGRLVRADGLITEVKASGICTCKFEIMGRITSDFYYTETLASIKDVEVGGWLEFFEVDASPRIPLDVEISTALRDARTAFREDNKKEIDDLVAQLCNGIGDQGVFCGAGQRRRRVRELLMRFAQDGREIILPDIVLSIRDCLVP